jgi:replicative DNA helicase
VTASDPFDFGIGFKPASERIRGERDRRLLAAQKQLPFGIAVLDDWLRSIMPHDLILIGARTGVGKTELTRTIATKAAERGKRVHYFALEAEQDELERRTKFSILAGLIPAYGIRLGTVFNYPDWYRGRFEAQLAEVDAEADQVIGTRLKTLSTYYRGPKFDHDDIRRILLAEQDRADLVALDHLHYVDNDDDNENRGMREIITVTRNTALLIGLPMLVVVHLRKRAAGSKALVPGMEDIHGSSDIAKNCTHAIMIEPAYSVPSRSRNLSNTFFTIAKDRGDGAKNLIALCAFDWRTKTYADTYTLGREVKGTFEPLGTDEVPYWAHRHEPLSCPVAGFDLGEVS